MGAEWAAVATAGGDDMHPLGGGRRRYETRRGMEGAVEMRERSSAEVLLLVRATLASGKRPAGARYRALAWENGNEYR